MFATHYFLPVLSCVLLSGCEAPPAARAELALANTVWVPHTITWVRPHPNDAELSSIQYAHFTLLSFRPQGRCLLISDYHSLGDADTIIVSTESPSVDSGHYRLEPYRVVVRSKNLSHYFTPPGERYEACTDTLSITGRTLVFRGVEYRPYTKLAGQSIDSFWTLW
ncbi:hypothetical protein ACFST9_15210 [Hymenobacter monticola]|uniref:Lipoprotein n=1 Tax=Hymenobacter monticola TaxID=1705399 RepID=A0ABY4B0P5_9BACT|nr:hypothetical protein [Hymenobacter monticola]UOE32736.1 hypothetical protein MTP16_16565 [Hymenobacter monticola]